VKLGIKEKRQEKGEEEGCMERKVHIGNNWWKIMTIYSKEMKTTRRRNERKQGRLYTHGRGLQQENRRKRSKKLGRGEGVWEEKIQRKDGKCKGDETDGMDRRKGMGDIEREQTRARRREWGCIQYVPGLSSQEGKKFTQKFQRNNIFCFISNPHFCY
jgi:hypothetical protein